MYDNKASMCEWVVACVQREMQREKKAISTDLHDEGVTRQHIDNERFYCVMMMQKQSCDI